ncbi:MAG TPA: signal peptidase I [Xanthobacteraceae bacterium]|nr:signal peptidase I [Xanthobacteraceae bacterium]
MPILLILIAVVAALSVRSFGAASNSMAPTIIEKEKFVIFKWYLNPTRGDIVVYISPANPNTRYVHRLIGMPGDRIQMLDGHLHINGQPVKRVQVDKYVSGGQPLKQWSETLPNGVTHRTLDIMDKGFYDNTPVYIVPDGHYFMMGDNRDNASDSRIKSGGPVPRDNLVGSVIFCLSRSCR